MCMVLHMLPAFLPCWRWTPWLVPAWISAVELSSCPPQRLAAASVTWCTPHRQSHSYTQYTDKEPDDTSRIMNGENFYMYTCTYIFAPKQGAKFNLITYMYMYTYMQAMCFWAVMQHTCTCILLSMHMHTCTCICTCTSVHGYSLALCLCLGCNDPGWSLTDYHLQPNTHTSDGLPRLHKEKGMDNIHQHLPKLWALHVGDEKSYIL